MDRKEKYESKINPDNPVNPVKINVSHKDSKMNAGELTHAR
jgi:hypothetical protein